MHKIAFCADVHLGNHRILGGEVAGGINKRCALALAALNRALALAVKENAAPLVVVGDLFDTDYPAPQLLTAVQRRIRAHNMPTILITGNHEQRSWLVDDHALGPLGEHATIVDSARVISLPESQCAGHKIDLLCMPYGPRPVKPWFAEQVAALHKHSGNKARQILCMHQGIADDDTPAFLRSAPDAVPAEEVERLCRAHHLRAALAGHWHDHCSWQSDDETIDVFQCGALVPTGWDNAGLEGFGKVVLYDPEADTFEVKEVPGPRFITVTLDELDDVVLGPTEDVFVRVLALPDEVQTCVAALETSKASGRVRDGMVITDSRIARASARSAATAARSEDTLQEAVMSFVEEMPLPEGVKRRAVLNRTNEYLGR